MSGLPPRGSSAASSGAPPTTDSGRHQLPPLRTQTSAPVLGADGRSLRSPVDPQGPPRPDARRDPRNNGPRPPSRSQSRSGPGNGRPRRAPPPGNIAMPQSSTIGGGPRSPMPAGGPRSPMPGGGPRSPMMTALPARGSSRTMSINASQNPVAARPLRSASAAEQNSSTGLPAEGVRPRAPTAPHDSMSSTYTAPFRPATASSPSMRSFQSVPDNLRLAKSPTDPLPATSPYGSAARDSSTTTSMSASHLSTSTSLSDPSTLRLNGQQPGQSIRKVNSTDEINVEDYIHMYTDEYRRHHANLQVDSARNSDASKLEKMPSLTELRQETDSLPAPKLPSLDLLDQQQQEHQQPSKPRTSSEIMAGKYDAPAVTFESSSAVPRDRYGFKKENSYVKLAHYDAWESGYNKFLERRRSKWNELMRQYNLPLTDPTHFPPRSEKVKRYVRKGIPPEWRGAAWFYYAGGPAKMASTPGLYPALAVKADNGELPEADRDHIERDLYRTFPDNIFFKPDIVGGGPRDSKLYNSAPGLTINGQPFDEAPMIQSLRRVLRAYAIQHPRSGYCQSLNFLAGMALLFLGGNEEKAFYLLMILTQEHLPGTHGLALEGANVDIGVLMSSLRDTLPIMWAKLDDRQDNSVEVQRGDMRLATGLPTVSLATTAWFMSCFVGTLPIESACRVWDCLFYEGSKTLFRVGLGIFKLGERDIMRLADPMEVFQVIQILPRRLLDANTLLEATYGRRMDGKGLLSQEVVEKRRAERRQLYRNERERFQHGAPLTPTSSSDADRQKKLGRAKSTLNRFRSRNRDS